MKKFELKIDVNTRYIKAIRFIGAFMMGLAIGATLIKFRSGSDIDWLNTITTTLLGFTFAIFPGKAKKQSLTIDEDGIQLHNYTFHWGERKELKWGNISAVGVDKHKIRIKNSIGSTEKIKLPLHTNEQIANLKAYLKEVAAIKEVTYLA